MTSSQSAGAKERAVAGRRASTTVAAFVFGLPMATAILYVLLIGPLSDTLAHRYVSHPVECVEVVMFCCAVSALGAKLWRYRTERAACRADLLPPWDGE